MVPLGTLPQRTAMGDCARGLFTLRDGLGLPAACEGAPDLLFTENESNAGRLWGIQSRTPFVKDGIHETVVNGAEGKVNPQGVGTKVSAHYHLVGAIAFRSTSTSTVIAGAASVPAIRPGGRLW